MINEGALAGHLLSTEALVLRPAKASEMIGCDVKALYGLHRDGFIRIVQDERRRRHFVDMRSVRAFLALPNARQREALKAAGPKRQFKPRSTSVCYFIGSDQGPIKIGNSVNPTKRLETFQTAHPYALTILATTGGGRDKEREYHERFAAHRLNGEWFERHPDILAEVSQINGAA